MPTPELTYLVQIDWDNNGKWTDTGEDVTARVMGLSWSRGKDRPHYLAGKARPGGAKVLLNNVSGDYSPLNTSSPLTGNLLPGRRVRIRSTGSGSIGTRWQGFIKDIDPRPGVTLPNTCIINCVGALGHIANRDIEVEMSTTIRTDQAVGKILDAAGWPKDYDDEVTTDTPAGYWRLGETSSTMADSSANSNVGTVSNGTRGETGLLGDDTDKSYLGDGSTSKIDCTSDSALDDLFATGATVEAWINADTDGEGNTGRIVDKAVWGFYVHTESGSTMKLGFAHTWSGNDGVWSTDNAVITTNATHHVAVTYNGSAAGNTPLFYVDGVLVASSTTATPTTGIDADAASNLIIGNNTGSTLTFDGHLDEVAIYASVLTVARIKAHYIAGVQQWRDLDVGETTMTRWWVDRKSVSSALRVVEETEFGLIYEKKDGKIAFRNRQSRFSNRTSAATFDDVSGATLSYSTIKQRNPDRGIFNSMETDVQLFTAGSLATLWVYPETTAPFMAPGESLTFWARYPVHDTTLENVGVDAWTTPAENTDYDANSLEGGGGTDLSSSIGVVVTKFGESMKMVFTNNHATLPAYLVNSGGTIVLQARGTPVIASDPIQIRAEDDASQLIHLPRTFTSRRSFMPTTANAITWADVNLDLYAAPVDQLVMMVNGNRSTATLDEVEDRDLTDLMTIAADNDAGLGFDQTWFMESENVTVDKNLSHRATWTFSSATNFALYWVIDTSLLGTSTKPGF